MIRIIDRMVWVALLGLLCLPLGRLFSLSWAELLRLLILTLGLLYVLIRTEQGKRIQSQEKAPFPTPGLLAVLTAMVYVFIIAPKKLGI